MSFVKKMYGNKKTETSDGKNPNRVSGGLRAQGSDKVTFMSEDGTEESLPSHKYVQSIEEQLKVLRQSVSNLEKRLDKHSIAVKKNNDHNNTWRGRDDTKMGI